MFIRVKTRRDKQGGVRSYAYLVKSFLYKRGPRQKVIQYLGRVYVLPDPDMIRINTVDFRGSWKRVVRLLIVQELQRRGFKKVKNLLKEGRFKVDLLKKEVVSQDQSIVLKINQGFLCNFTLRKVFEYKPPLVNDLGVGKDLGNWLLLAGIAVNQEQFLELFKKISRSMNQSTMINNAKRC